MTSSESQIIKDRLSLLNGKQFQSKCWEILKFKYSDLETPRMQNDLGNDGYSFQGEIFFAVYGIEGIKYDNADTKDKITSDYEKFNDEWIKFKKFKQWIFLTKDHLMGIPHKEIVRLNTIDDGVKKLQWGIDDLMDIVKTIPQTDLERIFQLEKQNVVNINTEFNTFTQNEEKDFGIISNIIDYVIANNKIIEVHTDGNQMLTNIRLKMELNFKENDLKNIQLSYTRLYSKKTLVEEFVKIQPRDKIDSFIDKLQSDYRKLQSSDTHETEIERVEIIEQMAYEYIPEKFKTNPEYIAIAKAIVIYFFEMCYIGKKRKDEVPELTLFTSL